MKKNVSREAWWAVRRQPSHQSAVLVDKAVDRLVRLARGAEHAALLCGEGQNEVFAGRAGRVQLLHLRV